MTEMILSKCSLYIPDLAHVKNTTTTDDQGVLLVHDNDDDSTNTNGLINVADGMTRLRTFSEDSSVELSS